MGDVAWRLTIEGGGAILDFSIAQASVGGNRECGCMVGNTSEHPRSIPGGCPGPEAPPANVHTFTDSPGTHVFQGLPGVNIAVNVMSDVHHVHGNVHWNKRAFPRVREHVNIGVNFARSATARKTLGNPGQNPIPVNL